jgi:hypothetical protein
MSMQVMSAARAASPLNAPFSVNLMFSQSDIGIRSCMNGSQFAILLYAIYGSIQLYIIIRLYIIIQLYISQLLQVA